MSGQMSLALPVATDPSGLATTDLRGVSKTAAMVSAIVDAIPMVGHAKGTHRETVQRPVAYLYARRDGLGPEDRRLVASICERVTGVVESGEIIAAGWSVWLRLNGERAATGRFSSLTSSMMSTKPTDAAPIWDLDIASRCPPAWSNAFDRAEIEIGDDMRGTLAGILLALSWSHELAALVQWRRDGLLVGEDMRVRADLAEARGELDIDTLTRVHRLLATPATAPLMLALVDVPSS